MPAYVLKLSDERIHPEGEENRKEDMCYEGGIRSFVEHINKIERHRLRPSSDIPFWKKGRCTGGNCDTVQ